MATRRFAAKVSTEGELVIAEPLPFRAALRRLRGQVVYVLVERLKFNRSTDQNKRYWGMLVPLAAEVLSADRPLPLSKDQTHEVLKLAFIGHDQTALGPVPKSSAALNTEEFAAFSNRIEHWLLHDHGIVVPAKDELPAEMVL